VFGLGLLVTVLLGLTWLGYEQSDDIEDKFIYAGLASIAAINSLLLLIPLSIIYALPAGQPRKTMTLVVLGLLGLALLQVGMLYQAFQDLDKELAERSGTLGTLFVFGIIASQFVANALAGHRPRH
jgi:hypothetical protein